MCRAKPNGSARIILNMSAPAGCSVNEGIDKDRFPATMSSTAKWLAVLNNCGRNCHIMKVDWSDAYKHIHVLCAGSVGLNVSGNVLHPSYRKRTRRGIHDG
jgi:hypothetical protein